MPIQAGCDAETPAKSGMGALGQYLKDDSGNAPSLPASTCPHRLCPWMCHIGDERQEMIEMAKKLKPPGLVVAHPSLFQRWELDLFQEQILCNPKATEHDASRFFERFPKFLLIGEGKELQREVALYGPDGLPLGRVDFFRRSYGKKFWDIMELKSPQAPLIVKAGFHPKLSAQIEGALSQAEDYRDELQANEFLKTHLFAKGIAISHPEILVIAGVNNREVPEEVIQNLFERLRRRGLRLYSYSDLLEFGREHFKSNVIVVPGYASQPVAASKEVLEYEEKNSSATAIENDKRTENHFRSFHGHYRVAASRGEIRLPARWRSRTVEMLHLVLWPLTNPQFLLGLPIERWTVMMDKLRAKEEANLDDAKVVALQRIIGAGSAPVVVQKLGVLRLEAWMLEKVGITREAALIGRLDKFELWSPDRYEAVLAMDRDLAAGAIREMDL